MYFQHDTKDDLIGIDPSRIASSVRRAWRSSAGAILRTGLTIQGLTTAAGLQLLVAAIGLSAGVGMDSLSVASTGLGVVAFMALRRF